MKKQNAGEDNKNLFEDVQKKFSMVLRIKADATGLKLDFCKGLFIFVR